VAAVFNLRGMCFLETHSISGDVVYPPFFCFQMSVETRYLLCCARSK